MQKRFAVMVFVLLCAFDLEAVLQPCEPVIVPHPGREWEAKFSYCSGVASVKKDTTVSMDVVSVKGLVHSSGSVSNIVTEGSVITIFFKLTTEFVAASPDVALTLETASGPRTWRVRFRVPVSGSQTTSNAPSQITSTSSVPTSTSSGKQSSQSARSAASTMSINPTIRADVRKATGIHEARIHPKTISFD
jgi:hypothetical protein